ncbi:MAG: hypothetical protein ACI3VA_11260 [Candidatus Limivicinus sp.]
MRLIAAVLFLAVSAYAGAKLWGRLVSAPETQTVRAVTLTDSAELEGIVIRREQLCPAGEGLFADGERLGAGTVPSVPGSALYYRSCDGLERLSPELLEDLDVQKLQALLAEKPSPQEGGRLVLDHAWYYAALVPADEPVPDSGRCRVLFDGFAVPAEAEILSLSSEENGQRALVLRLTLGGDAYMKLRKCSAELIFSQYSGLRLPEEAVHRDEDGNNFVYTITAGVVERRAVDIIYSEGDLCIAAFSADANGLREGNLVIVSGQEDDEGKVTA